ncbi:uncharacterized protein LOC124167849 [Ischnura elegans]|uniref:uncharacterized protein LOC124167849 n=1 Tax=Ischnura elegans TaxID=197161 RepID=UPI001ED8BBDE|nr:uncharacterized protein LOC124167849 [Ischnura elegans]
MMMANRVISYLISPVLRKPLPCIGVANPCLTRRRKQLLWSCSGFTTDFRSTSSTPVPRDLLLDKLRSASSGEQILKLVGSHHSIMNQSHVLEALLSLGSLQKREASLKVKQEIIHSPEFLKLSQRLKVHSRALALHETIGVLKAMVQIGVPTSSPIVNILLQLIRHRVNDLVPGQIVFVDSLLEKMQRSPLLEALRIALPLIFEAKLHTVVGDEDVSPAYLADLLSYASKRKLSRDTTHKILLALSKPKTMEEIEVRAAQSIINSLCSNKALSFSVKDGLISRCLEVISNSFHHCSKNELDTVTSGISKACSKGFLNFYNEDFVDAYVHYIIRCDVGLVQAVWAVKKLTRMGHINIELLDYIAKNVEASPQTVEDGSAALLICLVNGFSQANYKPKNWDIIEEAILKNEHIKSGKLELPWLKFGMELASLGCFSTVLLQRIFQEEFLKKFLSREYNLIDQLQLLLLHQAVKTLYPSYVGPYPPEKMIAAASKLNGDNVEQFVLQGALEKGLGGAAYVHQGLRTHLGHFIDHVIVMRKGGYPVALNLHPSKDCFIEDLVKPSDSFLLAILVMPPSCYSSNCQRLKGPPSLMIKTLEALNCSVLPLSLSLWNGLPDNEKIPYLMREIKIKYEERALSEGSGESVYEKESV